MAAGLQAAPELNGALGECGALDLTTERYAAAWHGVGRLRLLEVTLADGKETLKKVKELSADPILYRSNHNYYNIYNYLLYIISIIISYFIMILRLHAAE